MADLQLQCLAGSADRYAAGPTLSFTMRATELTGAVVHSIMLRAQIRIEPQRRRYSSTEAEQLGDVFGEPARWADTVRPMQFAQVSAMVPGFSGTTEFEISVPCTYDLEIAATSYFHALTDGVIPLLFLFSGTVFTKGGATGLTISPVSWKAEASYELPVAVWREMMDRFFPNCGWIRLSQDTLHALGAYKTAHAVPTWEQAITSLLSTAPVAPSALPPTAVDVP
jgi:hypothetical protein